MPRMTDTVYTRQVTTRIRMVSPFPLSTPKRTERASDRRGVAREKVVAVPASRAITARMSMSFPRGPSVRFPRIGLQASEYFCLWQPRTWSMKPKQAARVA